MRIAAREQRLDMWLLWGHRQLSATSRRPEVSPVAQYRIVNIGNSTTNWLLEFIDAIGDKLVFETTRNLIGLHTDNVRRIRSRLLAQMNAFF